ncbi:MAG: GPP34 family phosphoprotein [Xanthomonadales bacterium]|nr:GPP34 family phosphoprotein [Xanthomonadales bacterium]MBK7145453.1 GPP34 family phosphoprotein [Xanthomonadales bacterium]MCC6563237.1 GPP34 family phosphoprotein [Xanthomonadales bacterium]
MILAERLCLFVLDPERGRERVSCDARRLPQAIAGLVLVDLMLAGRVRIQGSQLQSDDALPIAHPVLAEAARLLAAHGRIQSLQAAAVLLRGKSRRWHKRMLQSLAARDVLELRVPFPFLRRHHLRSRQAFNESLALLQSAVTGAAADTPALALALATDLAGVLPDLLPVDVSRRLLNALATLGESTTRGERGALLQLLRDR